MTPLPRPTPAEIRRMRQLLAEQRALPAEWSGVKAALAPRAEGKAAAESPPRPRLQPPAPDRFYGPSGYIARLIRILPAYGPMTLGRATHLAGLATRAGLQTAIRARQAGLLTEHGLVVELTDQGREARTQCLAGESCPALTYTPRRNPE